MLCVVSILALNHIARTNGLLSGLPRATLGPGLRRWLQITVVPPQFSAEVLQTDRGKRRGMPLRHSQCFPHPRMADLLNEVGKVHLDCKLDQGVLEPRGHAILSRRQTVVEVVEASWYATC